MNKYYVYAYLDPRKPGNYVYNDILFEYEPFYVGCGCGSRINSHLHEATRFNKNSVKLNKIRKLIGLNMPPIIVKLRDNLCREDSRLFEMQLISVIGRIDLKTGTLTNLTEGGEGASHTEETKKKIGKSVTNLAFHTTDVYRKKLSKAAYKKTVCQYTMSNVLIEKYESCSVASRLTGIPASSIRNCRNNRLKHAGNFIWK